MKILYFDLFSGISAEALFSALCDIYDAKNLEYQKEKVPVLDILCSECTLCPGNVFEKDETDFAIGASKFLQNNKNFDVFCAVKRIISQIKPDFIMSSPIYDGSGFKDGKPIPSVEVMKLFKDLKIPWRTIDKNEHLAECSGICLVKSLANDFGTMPGFEIDKIGYGTDGKRVVRIVEGFDKRYAMSDIFEMSEDFFAAKDTAYC